MEVLYTANPKQQHSDDRTATASVGRLDTVLGNWAGASDYTLEELLRFDMAGLECRIVAKLCEEEEDSLEMGHLQGRESSSSAEAREPSESITDPSKQHKKKKKKKLFLKLFRRTAKESPISNNEGNAFVVGNGLFEIEDEEESDVSKGIEITERDQPDLPLSRSSSSTPSSNSERLKEIKAKKRDFYHRRVRSKTSKSKDDGTTSPPNMIDLVADDKFEPYQEELEEQRGEGSSDEGGGLECILRETKKDETNDEVKTQRRKSSLLKALSRRVTLRIVNKNDGGEGKKKKKGDRQSVIGIQSCTSDESSEATPSAGHVSDDEKNEEGAVYRISLIDLIECYENSYSSHCRGEIGFESTLPDGADQVIDLVLPRSRENEKEFVQEYSELRLPPCLQGKDEGGAQVHEEANADVVVKEANESTTHTHSLFPACEVLPQCFAEKEELVELELEIEDGEEEGKKEEQSSEEPESEQPVLQIFPEDDGSAGCAAANHEQERPGDEAPTVLQELSFLEGESDDTTPDAKRNTQERPADETADSTKESSCPEGEGEDTSDKAEASSAIIKTPYKETSLEVKLVDREKSPKYKLASKEKKDNKIPAKEGREEARGDIAPPFFVPSYVSETTKSLDDFMDYHSPLIQTRLLQTGAIQHPDEIAFVPDYHNRLGRDEDDDDVDSEYPVTYVKTEIWQATFPSTGNRRKNRRRKSKQQQPIYFATAVLMDDQVDLERLRSVFWAYGQQYSSSDSVITGPPVVSRAPDDVAWNLTGYKPESMAPLCHTIDMKLFIDESIVDFPLEMDGSYRINIGSGVTGICLSISLAKFFAVAHRNPEGVEITSFVIHRMREDEPDEDDEDDGEEEELVEDDELISVVESLDSFYSDEDSRLSGKLRKQYIPFKSESVFLTSTEAQKDCEDQEDLKPASSQVRISVTTVDNKAGS